MTTHFTFPSTHNVQNSLSAQHIFHTILDKGPQAHALQVEGPRVNLRYL